MLTPPGVRAQNAEAQAWLRGACDAASAGPLAGEAGTYAAARVEAFPADAANAYRHLRVHEFSDTVAALPQEELQVGRQGHDTFAFARQAFPEWISIQAAEQLPRMGFL